MKSPSPIWTDLWRLLVVPMACGFLLWPILELLGVINSALIILPLALITAFLPFYGRGNLWGEYTRKGQLRQDDIRYLDIKLVRSGALQGALLALFIVVLFAELGHVLEKAEKTDTILLSIITDIYWALFVIGYYILSFLSPSSLVKLRFLIAAFTFTIIWITGALLPSYLAF